MPERPTNLAELIRAAITSRMSDVHTAIVARVTKYDAALQKVTVQSMIKSAHVGEDDERKVENLPAIVGVPVQFPGGGGYRITFPIQTGDTGLLVFSEASLDVWLAKGGDVDPLDDNRFMLSSAVFIPGVRDFAHALKTAAGDRMTLGKDDGLQIHIDPSKIKHGSNIDAELEPAALAETVKTYLEALNTYIKNLAFVVTGTANLVTGTVAGTAVNTSTPPAVPNLGSGSIFIKKT